ncbi:amidohydrolase family protein [Sandaracinobacter neustonicus]|uniref:Amidohydrolase family protein n=1 Tax=Sandaracinobacter neustonicus TaxID=1715348 RepID=A0A501XNP0_9SPHN|nr:amidohydrolase family protein [Sandaracinobacter neustonicus]TPE62196.1 amidohydrolase family protein [Sandaracinobacter neustonicus]
MTTTPIEADLLISGAEIISMNPAREVFRDGALAIKGNRIVAVGKREALEQSVRARATHDARGFVLTPGFHDGHIHITGDPLTRGLVRRVPDQDWGDNLSKWVIPLFKAQTPSDEALAAQLSALAMIRHGTTSFMEAGTVIHLDAVMEGLAASGIRGRVGRWVEGRTYDPAADPAIRTNEAIALLESEVAAYPDDGETLLAAWPQLVGHSTNSDEVWLAAKSLADSNGLKVSAHISPRASDPEWFLANTGRRPVEHLAHIGALGPNICLTHLADTDMAEVELLAETGTSAIHCPHAAFLGGFGLAKKGLHPEMMARGIPLMLGTDGMAADILSSARLMAAAYRDARDDQDLLPATKLLELMTVDGAKVMGWEGVTGALIPGAKADFILHDTRTPEWGGPLFDSVGQLALSAPPSAVHSVWIDGRQVLESGRNLLLDEEKLLADAVQAGQAIVARTGLPIRTPWPVL